MYMYVWKYVCICSVNYLAAMKAELRHYYKGTSRLYSKNRLPHTGCDTEIVL